ncbi:hypothetical protein EV714DRAFT_203965 [Schizophyllum commune]
MSGDYGQSTPNSAPDLTPKGLINSDGNYILQQDDMYGLVKYIWAGLLLPVTEREYITSLNLSQETIGIIDSALGPLIGAYIEAKAHCETFRTITYPSITGIASDVFDFAQIASGQGTSPSWAYASLMQTIRALGSATAANAATLQQTVKDIVSYLSTAISDIQAKVQTAIDDLRAFEQTAMQDKQSILQFQSAIVALIQIEEGDINSLLATLRKYQADLEFFEFERETGIVRACTKPRYLWVPFIGLFTASVVDDLPSEKASAMATTISSIKQLIYTQEGQIDEQKGVAANLAAVESDVNGLLAALGPAIATLQNMNAILQAIVDDLTSIQKMATSAGTPAGVLVIGITDEQLTQKWADLAVAVGKYQQACGMDEAQMATIDELADQLSERVII